MVNYRWKKGFSPRNLHFYWVARLTDLTTFKWLLLILPELKRQQLVHNEYYGGNAAQRSHLKSRLSQLRATVESDPTHPQPSAAATPPPGLPADWQATYTPEGSVYYYNVVTHETSWEPPVGAAGNGAAAANGAAAGNGIASASGAAVRAELTQVQNELRAASTNHRQLRIVLYLTGCKPEQVAVQSDPRPGSTGEMINALLSTLDPETGEPCARQLASIPLPLGFHCCCFLLCVPLPWPWPLTTQRGPYGS